MEGAFGHFQVVPKVMFGDPLTMPDGAQDYLRTMAASTKLDPSPYPEVLGEMQNAQAHWLKAETDAHEKYAILAETITK